MIADYDAVHSRLNRLLRVFDMLDTLEHDGPVPFGLDQLQVFPRMCSSGENVSFPFARGKEDIILWGLVVVFLGKLGAEDRVRETGLVTNAGCEGYVGIVEVGRPPSEGPGVEGHNEDSKPIGLGAVEKLQKRDESRQSSSFESSARSLLGAEKMEAH